MMVIMITLVTPVVMAVTVHWPLCMLVIVADVVVVISKSVLVMLQVEIPTAVVASVIEIIIIIIL